MDVKEAFISRRSVRRFLPDPIPKDKIKNILECSAFAPSGHNIQPWHVYVVEGKKKEAITKSILGSIEDGSAKNFKQEFDYYPTEWFEPFVSRRRAVGFELYKLLNIGRDDFEARDKQMQENFHFFGAPVGMFITMDRRLATGTFMDVGQSTSPTPYSRTLIYNAKWFEAIMCVFIINFIGNIFKLLFFVCFVI